MLSLAACSLSNTDGESGSTDPAMTGRWFASDRDIPNGDFDMEALDALGYLGATTEATVTSGISVYDEQQAFDGINLFVSGHAAKAYLMDMNGNVVHEWGKEAQEVWSDLPVTAKGGLLVEDALKWVPGQDASLLKRFPPGLAKEQSRGYSYWRRAHVFPNGDLLAIFSNLGVVKFDKDSKVIWATPFMAHHDFEVGPDGRIYVLGKKISDDTRFRKDGISIDDTIVVLASDGTMEREFSIGEAFLRSQYASVIGTRTTTFDLLHTNTIEYLDGSLADRIPAMKKGNLLVSCLRQDLIAVVDMETETIVWTMGGMFDNMHQPTVLANGNILVFDNLGNRGYSRVFEFDPLTQQIRWMYAPDPGFVFHSAELGSVQRLPNGNTLVTESTRGRVFELTPSREIVWEYLSPYRGGKNDELVAATFEIVRYEKSYISGWLNVDGE